MKVIIAITVTIGTTVIVICAYIMWRTISNHHASNCQSATNSFHPSNKLVQGDFGPVYKGQLHDCQEIAVKRLSRASGQDLEEFINEVVVISKLQESCKTSWLL
ncbi:G-type lectin S-receptor-like serine/threonine-protein kinase SD1-29 [Glycine soja]|uniref:G-type lectin S-receptor-like serine/threonine-protein kinase SD1-29 n=1 Tax=Glycine soja TaxID=3848 RepID=A0A0B2PEK4_GLYSO|nr:G-type lectin S-receptor-like serine/threonine-protein kinase SD1-29 [Glycine soja]